MANRWKSKRDSNSGKKSFISLEGTIFHQNTQYRFTLIVQKLNIQQGTGFREISTMNLEWNCNTTGPFSPPELKLGLKLQHLLALLVILFNSLWNDFADSEQGESMEHICDKKLSFSLRISSVNVTKSAGKCGFGHIYWINPKLKNSFFVEWHICDLTCDLKFF